MKMSFDIKGKSQPDPFIFEDDGLFFLYVTADEGVEVYQSFDLFGVWTYKGVVTEFENAEKFWAPSVIKIQNKYYMYVSCNSNGNFQFMHVASSDSPLGPFKK